MALKASNLRRAKGGRFAVRKTKAKGLRFKEVFGVKVKLTKAGQAFTNRGFCIATSLKGVPCCCPVTTPGVPYCNGHMARGDPSCRVVAHPRAGKILVAARDLPKGYRLPLWGLLKKKKDLKEKALEWAFDITGGWFLDPMPCKGSLVQFCPCPGPNETAALTVFNNNMIKGDKYGYWMFVTAQRLRKNWQVTLQYGSTSKESEEFFAERGITRLDVGTKAHPAPRRRNAPRLKAA